MPDRLISTEMDRKDIARRILGAAAIIDNYTSFEAALPLLELLKLIDLPVPQDGQEIIDMEGATYANES